MSGATTEILVHVYRTGRPEIAIHWYIDYGLLFVRDVTLSANKLNNNNHALRRPWDRRLSEPHAQFAGE